MAKLLSVLKPSVIVICFGFFSAINASMVWGGVFGFFPPALQTEEFLARAFSSQTACFIASSIAFIVVAYYHARLPRRFMLVSATLALLCAGIFVFLFFEGAIVYDLAALLAGACLGYGSCAMSLFYLVVLASSSIEEGTRKMLLSSFYSAVFYLLLALLPHVVSGVWVPLLVLPTTCVAMLFQVRKSDGEPSFFAERPSTQAGIYKNAFKGYWRTTLCLGALAVCAGIMRAYSVTAPGTGYLVNVFSMMGLLAAMFIMIFFIAKKSFSFSTLLFYRGCFPLLITGFLLLPILKMGLLFPFSVFVNTVFGLCTVFMMIQCIQAAHNQGINPALLYGAIAGFVFAAHNAGYLSGGYVEATVETKGLSLLFISLVAVYALGFMFFLGEGGFRRKQKPLFDPEAIELFNRPSRTGEESAGSDARAGGWASSSDEVARQRMAFKERYLLSAREAEIVDLLSRGDSAARIAEELFVSENTVRTHIRRIYAKVGVHKKQDMLNLLKEL